jgi:hypothetical protein
MHIRTAADLGPSSAGVVPKLPWLRGPGRAGNGLWSSNGKARALIGPGVFVDLKADFPEETPSISEARTPGINSVLDALKKRP